MKIKKIPFSGLSKAEAKALGFVACTTAYGVKYEMPQLLAAIRQLERACRPYLLVGDPEKALEIWVPEETLHHEDKRQISSGKGKGKPRRARPDYDKQAVGEATRRALELAVYLKAEKEAAE